MIIAEPAETDRARSYRRDVDGLRAIAVLSVILFHVDAGWLPGGFVGVDVFFVISGFLITRNIGSELLAGRFSLADFYRRRIQRIIPALAVVVFVCCAAGGLLLLPADSASVSRSALWSMLSAANVHFWLHLDTSYYAADSAQRPLLHLWSLGVEEQFYLLWPLAMLLGYRRARSRVFLGSVVAIAAASFLLGERVFDSDPSFSFYMLPARAGELMLGALVALFVLDPQGPRLRGVAAEAGSTVGVALLAWALFALDEGSRFPGFNALPPTLGSALILWAGHESRPRLQRALCWRPLVAIGLVSYSAYLWHWPILAFLRYGLVDLSPGTSLLAVLLTFVLAAASYRYVEQPFRRSVAPPGRIFLRQWAAPTCVIGLLAGTILLSSGYGIRHFTGYRAQLSRLYQQTRIASRYDYVCQDYRLDSSTVDPASCVVGADVGTGQARALLWGDSHAAHYIGVLGRFAENAGFSFQNLVHSACPPLLGAPDRFVSAALRPDCVESLRFVHERLADFPAVVVSASWSTYQRRSDAFLDAVRDTATRLANRGQLVVLVGKAPIFPGYQRLCLAKQIALPFLRCTDHDATLDALVAASNEALRSFAAGTANVEYYDLTEHLCPGGRCSPYDASGAPLYHDRGHLSLAASWRLGERILASHGLPAGFERLAERLRREPELARLEAGR